MKLYLVRHGEFSPIESLFKQTDGPLTEKGIQQARDCGEYFFDKKIDKIYSSDLKRTIQTANDLNSKLNLKINLESKLREINRGEWEFTDPNDPKYADFKSEWDRHGKDIPYPNGECGQDVLKRALELISSVKENSDNESIIFVTHGGVIRTLLAEYSKLDQTKRFNFDPDFCSITLIEIDHNKTHIINQCDTKHIKITNNSNKK